MIKNIYLLKVGITLGDAKTMIEETKKIKDYLNKQINELGVNIDLIAVPASGTNLEFLTSVNINEPK